MIVYGRNAVREAIRGRRQVEQVWATESLAGADWLQAMDPAPASGEELERLCGSPEHQGICAEVSPYPYVGPDTLLAADDALVVCLDEVQDPHNLGAVCRVAESAGAAGIVLPERRSVEVTPAVCKASAGAVEHLAIARAPNLADWLSAAKANDTWVYGAAPGPDAVPYDQPDYRGRVVLVLGSEGKGLRPRVAKTCDALIALPQHGRVGSLNVSTAASALLYGILHFRRGLDKAP